MYLKTSYSQDFDDLYMYLKAKYPKELFDLDGIGKQTDMSQFSKNFFKAKITSDASIDENANVDDSSVIAYSKEMPKPWFRINAYYIIWKELRNLFDLETANNIVEKILTGEIYPNDFYGVFMPYSYYGKTVLCLKINGEIKYSTIQDFFTFFQKDIEDEINLKNVEILDENNTWVNVSRILRHKSHTNLIEIETKKGNCTIVTTDHPVILQDGQKDAINLTTADVLKESNTKLPITEEKIVSNEFAYFVGFLIGDGWVHFGKPDISSSGRISIRQKDIRKTKIFKICNALFDNIKIYKQGTQINIYNTELARKLTDIGFGSNNKKLPLDILTWNISAIKSLIAGIIDADGTVNKANGIVDVRVSSFELVQQIGEILNTLQAGKIRTSFCGKYSSKKSFKSNYDLYRVSCRFEDKEFALYSEKINKHKEIIYKKMNKDGRWESQQINKIINIDTPEYVYDITTDSGQFHCQGLIQHNCYNYDPYDIMTKGLEMVNKVRCLPPKYLYSFKSQLEQFVVIASNSTLGATGLASLLVIMSWYVKNILKTHKDAHFSFASDEDVWAYVKENIVSFIYTINQPMRSNQSPFTNISVYDRNFLEQMKEDYIFPDLEPLDINLVEKIQELFLDIMNEEMKRTPLTFPVTTACFSIDEERNIQDKEFLHMIAEKNKEFGFINIYCGASSTLSSCCRLRSDNSKTEWFHSFGSGKAKIGSLGVCTINLPRLALKYQDEEEFLEQVKHMTYICAQVNHAKRNFIKKAIAAGKEPLYSLGYIDINTQYNTTGIIGFSNAIQYLGKDLLDEDGQELGLAIINAVNNENKRCEKEFNAPHSVEQIPGEGTAVKLAKKDQLLGYQEDCDIYSNQFIDLRESVNLLERIKLQGMFDKYFTGGGINVVCAKESRHPFYKPCEPLFAGVAL